MALNIESIVAELETATILKLSELAKAIEEKFGISAAVPIAVAGPATSGVAGEQTESAVELTAASNQKAKVIKAVREVTGLGLKEVRATVDGAPVSARGGVSKEEAEALKAALEEVGASVTVK